MYKDLEKRQACFWKNFQHQYLQSIKFSKDATQRKNCGLYPQVSDVVILHSADPRLRWRKGIVTELYPSADGEIRKAKVTTSTGQTIRALCDLYPLELQAEGYKDLKLQDESRRLAGAELKARLQNENAKIDFEGFESPDPPQQGTSCPEIVKCY